jgi:hypothetical protein
MAGNRLAIGHFADVKLFLDIDIDDVVEFEYLDYEVFRSCLYDHANHYSLD